MKRFETQTRVRFAETDAAGIVYYNEFFVYFEVGRIEMFRELGLTYSWRIPIVDTQCTFHAPARFDDVIEIHSQVEHVGTASFRIGHEVFQVNDDSKVLLATGRVIMVNVGEERKSAPLPDDVRTTLASVAGDA